MVQNSCLVNKGYVIGNSKWINPGVLNLWPTGQMKPVQTLHLACRALHRSGNLAKEEPPTPMPIPQTPSVLRPVVGQAVTPSPLGLDNASFAPLLAFGLGPGHIPFPPCGSGLGLSYAPFPCGAEPYPFPCCGPAMPPSPSPAELGHTPSLFTGKLRRFEGMQIV